MLAKDSPRWLHLDHAYGSAQDLPWQLDGLLRDECYGDDPHDVLFGKLCHQGSTYSATYAAIPWCVHALPTQSLQGKIWLHTFIGKVAISLDAAPVPPDLEVAFKAAMEDAKRAVIEAAGQPGTPTVDYIHLLSAVPSTFGLGVTHRIVDLMLDSAEVMAICAHCHEELSVSASELPFRARHLLQHPTHGRKIGQPNQTWIAGTEHGAPVDVVSNMAPAAWDGTFREDNAFAWLVELATRAGHPMIADKVRALFGVVVCPNCGNAQKLWNAALAEQQASM